MGFSPLTFTGVSKFSSDFQTILNRAVQIAQLPIKALQNRDADVLQKKTLFDGLAGSVSALASGLKSLGETGLSRALVATSSNASVVAVTNSGATSPVTYTIDSITSIAAAASERTLIGYADSAATQVSSTGTVKLVIGDDEHELMLANNSLVGLRDKINQLGAGVTASILTTADGNYLSLSATATGATTLQLFDDPAGANTNLLTGTNQGSDAVFELNGIDVSQSTNLVNSVIPGVTFTLLDTSEDPVTLTLATSRGALSSALQDFASKYNALRDVVGAQVGPAAGLLTGNFVVNQIQSVLRNIASYRDNGISLSDLGIRFSDTGKASFDSTAFNALTDSQISAALDFVGSASEGLGGFSDDLSQFSDPASGLIASEQAGLDRIDKSIQAQIDELTQRIDVMQRGLALKLQQADTLLATLESQQTQLSASLEGLNLVLYGKKDN